MAEFTFLYRRCFGARFGFFVLSGLLAVTGKAGQKEPARHACACPDGRQFSAGASLFGKNSARVVITGFRPDAAPTAGEPPAPCRDLTVIGQVIRLKTSGDRPFLQRESLKRGTVVDICQSKIQFAEPKKFYDFFADDGSAVTLNDTDAASAPPDESPNASADGEQAENVSSDLTGKDLIQLVGRQEGRDDPGASPFNADDLKEGAYCIVRRQLKALSAMDENAPDPAGTASASAGRKPLTVWAGTLGRVEKRAGFRSEPLWVVELLPHSAPLSFSRSVSVLAETLRRSHPQTKKFVLPASDLVEINRFFDQYGVEWTRFGAQSEDAQAREALGTTVLPDIYDPPAFTLEQNLANARKIQALAAVQERAAKLLFLPKQSAVPNDGGILVLEEENPAKSAATVTPHFFRRQCFLRASKLVTSTVLRVSDADMGVFQPKDSAQVPDDYYAIDLKLQLKSDSGDSGFPVVCRFPLAIIDVGLVGEAERILAGQFEIRRQEGK